MSLDTRGLVTPYFLPPSDASLSARLMRKVSCQFENCHRKTKRLTLGLFGCWLFPLLAILLRLCCWNMRGFFSFFQKNGYNFISPPPTMDRTIRLLKICWKRKQLTIQKVLKVTKVKDDEKKYLLIRIFGGENIHMRKLLLRCLI